MTGPAGAAGFTDNRQDDIFSSDARRGFAFDFDLHGFGAPLLQGLRRQNVLDFRGADTEGQRAECAMGCRVGVPADDGHTRQGDALFRPHHVDDALERVVQVIQLNAELFAVFN